LEAQGYDDFDMTTIACRTLTQWSNGAVTAKDCALDRSFYQGKMERKRWQKWNLAGQVADNGNNYPMVDLSSPEAKPTGRLALRNF
jgi:hypothetical protein